MVLNVVRWVYKLDRCVEGCRDTHGIGIDTDDCKGAVDQVKEVEAARQHPDWLSTSRTM